MTSSLRIRVFASLLVIAIALVLIVSAPGRSVAQNKNELSQFDVYMGIAALQFVANEDLGEVLTDNPLLETGYELIGGPEAYNPFRGEVGFDDDIVAETTISATYSALIIPEGLRTDTTDLWETGPYDPGVQDAVNDSPPGSEADVWDAVDEALLDGMGGPLSVQPGMLDGLGLTYDEPILVVGARTQQPRSSLLCEGLRREWGIFFDTTDRENWDDTTGADPSAFNDFFYNGDTGLINRCVDGAISQHHIAFAGPGNGFTETDNPIITMSGSHGWIMFVPASQIPTATSFRFLEFVTDLSAPYDRDHTAASVYPTDLTQLMPISELPAIEYDATKDRPASRVTETTSSTSSTTSTTSSTASTAAPGGTASEPYTLDDPAGFFDWINGPTLIFIGAVLIAMGILIGERFIDLGSADIAADEQDQRED